jgi:hypothetical protein
MGSPSVRGGCLGGGGGGGVLGGGGGGGGGSLSAPSLVSLFIAYPDELCFCSFRPC